jgi:hypothetical protein
VGTRVPAGIQQHLDRADGLLAKVSVEPERRRRKELVRRAVRLLGKARKLTVKARTRRRISKDCAAVLRAAIREVKDDTGGLVGRSG